MNIPDTCLPWAQMMQDGTDAECATDQHRAILQNVRSDPCLSDETANLFFRNLAARSAASAPSTPAEAVERAYDAVRDSIPELTCQGRDVPAGSFVELVRLEPIDGLLSRVPDACETRGITRKELLSGITAEDLAVLTDEHDGPVSLGNGLSVVFVTDRATVAPILTRLQELMNRLGVPWNADARGCVLCVYCRSATGNSLKVPRVLDAIREPRFRPNLDCLAIHGLTRPLDGPGNLGLPEAVHRACTVRPNVWRLVST